jgi:hypothetical protein
MAQLAELRDQLKSVLAGSVAGPDETPLPPASELAERIKELKAAHTVDSSAERSDGRVGIAAAESVTKRIRRRIRPAEASADETQGVVTAEPTLPDAAAFDPALPTPVNWGLPEQPIRSSEERYTLQRRMHNFQRSLF